MGLAEVLQKRIRPRKDESDDEATYESDPVLDASVSSAENTDSEGESESQDAVGSLQSSKSIIVNRTSVRYGQRCPG